MKDNGLLKYYKTLPSEKGFLNVSAVPKVRIRSIKRGAYQNNILGQNYYLKCPATCDKISSVKHIYDAEILLSQIYAKAGLQTAIYLPISANNKTCLTCNDVSSRSVLPVVSHLYPLLGSDLGGKTYIRSLAFLSKEDPLLEEYDSYQIIGKQAMQEQTIMRLLDVASFNDDRHEMNFFYDIQKLPQNPQSLASQSGENKQQVQPALRQFPSIHHCQNAQDAIFNLQDEEQIMDYYRSFRPSGVVSIDYGASGIAYKNIIQGKIDPNIVAYANDFSYRDLTRTEFDRELIENEVLPELMDKTELAETIGSLNPGEVAQDISQTIGYEVNPEYVSALSQSYDDMAETLLK